MTTSHDAQTPSHDGASQRPGGVLRHASLKSSLHIAAGAIFTMVLVAVLGYLALPKTAITLAPVEGCRLDQRACSAGGLPGGGSIELMIEPRPVATSRPFTLHAHIEGLHPAKVAVDFSGVEMNMGITRLELLSAGGDRYSGQITLPVCVTGAMLWQASVVLETGDKVISIPFLFRTTHG